jgi:hypothetical protein
LDDKSWIFLYLPTVLIYLWHHFSVSGQDAGS